LVVEGGLRGLIGLMGLNRLMGLKIDGIYWIDGIED